MGEVHRANMGKGRRASMPAEGATLPALSYVHQPGSSGIQYFVLWAQSIYIYLVFLCLSLLFFSYLCNCYFIQKQPYSFLILRFSQSKVTSVWKAFNCRSVLFLKCKSECVCKPCAY